MKDVHDTPSNMRLLNADNMLCMIKHMDGADILAHFSWMHEVWAKVNAQGGKMDDLTFHTIIITSMPKEWDIIVGTLFTLKTSKEVTSSLTLYDTTLTCHWKPIPQTTQALATTQFQPNCSNDICSNPNCKQVGYTIDRCFKPGGGIEGQYPDWWKKKGNATRSGNSSTNQSTKVPVADPKPTMNMAMVPTTPSSQVTQTIATISMNL